MKINIDLGEIKGTSAAIHNGPPSAMLLDLEELLATRLLVQGNSGSGKSHLLRRILEQSAPWVQQCIIDPEGDFITLADKFGHLVIDASSYSEEHISQIAVRVRQKRASIVVNLEHLEVNQQVKAAALFLNSLFDIERAYWYPLLIVIDEAQLFAPAAGSDLGDDIRKLSLSAMTNLMCRGRKRGLAGIIATQRLAKLAKNVAAEASNFLMGRTFLDIDMARAADLLGMERRQTEIFRDLDRGHFIALGPALTRKPTAVKIAAVETAPNSSNPSLLPLPSNEEVDRKWIVEHNIGDKLEAKNKPTPNATIKQIPEVELVNLTTEQIKSIEQIRANEQAKTNQTSTLLENAKKNETSERNENAKRTADESAKAAPNLMSDLLLLGANNQANLSSTLAEPNHADANDMTDYQAIIEQIAEDSEASFQPMASLYQDFIVRCRIARLPASYITLEEFKDKFNIALAVQSLQPTPDLTDNQAIIWNDIITYGNQLQEKERAVFFTLARAALLNIACPSEERLAKIYGTYSLSRVKNLLNSFAKRDILIMRTDFAGRRAIIFPEFGIETAYATPI